MCAVLLLLYLTFAVLSSSHALAGDVVLPESHSIVKRDIQSYGPVSTPCTAYSLHVEPKTWLEAEQVCLSLSTTGELARIPTSSINDKLLTLLSDASIESAYFGATDAETEGVWKYSATDVCYDDWGNNLPSFDNTTNCILLQSSATDGHWADADCNVPSPFICQFREQLDCLFPSPCENGGVCKDTLMGYVCQCPDDFTGTNCETEIQHTCQSDAECQNGGTCDITNDQCHCQPNYDGETCEIELCAAPANDVTGFEFLDLQASFPSDTEWNLANDPAIASFSIGTDTFIVVYEVLEDFVSVGSFSPTPPTFQVLKTISFPGEFITHVEPFVMSGLQYVAIGLTARSVFYRWDGTDLVDEKDISANEGAEHLHFFSSGHGHFIVRSYSPQLSISSNSVIHRWDESSGEFVHHQDILTRDAKMSTTFSDDTSTYLFFASDSLNPLLEPRMLVQNDVNPNFSPLIINGINSASIDAVLTLKFGCQRYLVTEVASITKPEIYRWDSETGDFTTVAIPLTQTFYLINPAAFTYFEVGDAYPHFIHMGMSATPGFLRSLFVIKPSFGQVDLFEIIQYIDATPYPPLVSHAFKHDSEVYLLYSTSVDRHLMKWGPTP